MSRLPRLSILAASAGLLLGACREPTEITLRIRTNLACDQGLQGVAVYVGKPGADVEKASPTLVTTECHADGSIGSLVVVPSGSKSGALGVRVVAGLTRKPEDCSDGDYQGCIVARRSLRFTPHTALELDIDIDADCLSIGCDADHTCQRSVCVANNSPSLLTPKASDSESPSITGPAVRCGDDGLFCGTSGDVCCLQVDVAAQTTHGDCRQPQDCPRDSIVLRCDDDTDCPRDTDGTPGMCALSFEFGGPLGNPAKIGLSDCRFATAASLGSSFGLALCEQRKACLDSQFTCIPSAGEPNQLPGYYWCRVTLK